MTQRMCPISILFSAQVPPHHASRLPLAHGSEPQELSRTQPAQLTKSIGIFGTFATVLRWCKNTVPGEYQVRIVLSLSLTELIQ